MKTRIEHGDFRLELNDDGTIDVMCLIRDGKTYVAEKWDHGKVTGEVTGGCFTLRQIDKPVRSMK